MNLQSIVPIFTTERIAESREFWVTKLGFQVSFDHAHYLGLRAGPHGSPELAFMRPDADAPHVFAGRGASFSISVADADREHARFRELGVPILAPPLDQPWGAHGFVAQDPNGIVLFVSHPIPATVEFQACVR